MKKLILANCILAIAVIFSFCAKPDLQDELIPGTDNVAGDRVACNLVNMPSNTAILTLCGTNTNANKCVKCIGNVSQGVEVFPGGFINLNLQAPITFSISTNIQTAVNLNGAPPVGIPANGCQRFYMDANCVVIPI